MWGPCPLSGETDYRKGAEGLARRGKAEAPVGRPRPVTWSDSRRTEATGRGYPESRLWPQGTEWPGWFCTRGWVLGGLGEHDRSTVR